MKARIDQDARFRVDVPGIDADPLPASHPDQGARAGNRAYTTLLDSGDKSSADEIFSNVTMDRMLL